MDPIEKLKSEAWNELKVTRACNTCRHAPNNLGSPIARCLATNHYVDRERAWGHSACSISGKLWEPIPPRQPKPPGFWKRLGEAILKRIE